MKIRISLARTHDDSYNVNVERGLLKKIPGLLKKAKLGINYVIITDNTVRKLYGTKLLAAMKKAGLKTSLISFPAGENSKKLQTVADLAERMVKAGAKRDTVVVALGGGVVGDMAGLVASIYMRGIHYVHIPTTLLAMVDSSIGGKTGVDLRAGKNLIGSFHQPKMVLVDPLVLKTLPKTEFKNGYGEIVKHAVIASKPMFTQLEKKYKKLSSPAFLEKLITQNIRIKKQFVENDEKEQSTSGKSRMLLNYGHTIGHAIEKILKYKKGHGECVAIGMVLENTIAVNKKMLKNEEAERIISLLKKFGLPTTLPKGVTLGALEKTITTDKKVIDGRLHFALPEKIGSAHVVIL